MLCILIFIIIICTCTLYNGNGLKWHEQQHHDGNSKWMHILQWRMHIICCCKSAEFILTKSNVGHIQDITIMTRNMYKNGMKISSPVYVELRKLCVKTKEEINYFMPFDLSRVDEYKKSAEHVCI